MTELFSGAIGVLIGAFVSFFAQSISEERQRIIAFSCEIIDGVALSKFKGDHSVFAAAVAKSRILFSDSTVKIVEKMRDEEFTDVTEEKFANAVRVEYRFMKLIRRIIF